MLQEDLEGRFGGLMQAAMWRISAHNPEMWEAREARETQEEQVPWLVLDRLASCVDDMQAADWLLASARTQDMMGVVLGFEKLQRQLAQQDRAAHHFAVCALKAGFLAEAMRAFFLFWFGLPLDYWRSRQGYQVPVGARV